ncbi:MAG: diguanylate cyclase [bacterium]
MSTEFDRLFQVALDASPTAAVVVNSDGTIVAANRACAPIFLYAHQELIGRSVDQLLPEAKRASHARDSAYYRADPIARPMGDGQELHALRSDGSEVSVEVTLTPFTHASESFVIAAATNRSELMRAQETIQLQQKMLELANRRLSEMAAIDSLTGARNRRAGFEDLCARVSLARRSGHPLSVMMLDVDHFKAFVDTHGQQAGDDGLKHLVGLLRSTARRSDLVARFGGDIFVILLPETHAQGGSRCAERIRAALASADWAYQPLTATFGVQTYDPAVPGTDRGSIDEQSASLVDAAERALQHGKREGRDRVIHALDLPTDEARG